MIKKLKLGLFANLAFFTVVIGAIVFTFGFGSTIYLARQEVQAETDQKVNQAVTLVQNYVDGQLQRVEDVAYTLLSSKFSSTVRNEDGSGFVTIDPKSFVLPSESEVFDILEHFINTNPHICGVAVGFEPFVYTDTKGEYGFAAYVTNVSGRNERISLGEIHDFRQKEWYKEARNTNSPYWSRPFAETSKGEVVACFSVPLHGFGDRIVGVLALDINTDAFRNKCDEVTPIMGSEVSLVDREFNVISHPNQSYILKNIGEIEQYSMYQSSDSLRDRMTRHESGHYLVNKGTKREAMFYFAPIQRTGWTISIECPISEIYRGVNHMRRTTSVIAALSMLFMLLCFGFLFYRIQKVTTSKAVIDRDLTIASAVQMGMLPKLYPAFPERKDIDIYGFLKPAKTVGGDLYDYFIRDGKLFFCIGDVSGKGVPASLFMVVVRSLFRNISLHTDDPAEIVSSLNIAIAENNTHNMFCTMFLGILDLSNGELDYCNAGHNAPIVRRVMDKGRVDVHYATPKVNIAIGVIDGFEYESEHTVLGKGDAIFLYTDGVTEAEDVNKNLFGEEATLKALSHARKNNARTVKDYVDHVYRMVRDYAGSAEQSDDITMLVIEYKGLPVLHLKNNIENVPNLAEWLEMLASEVDLPEDKLFNLHLAMEEAVVNVMNYAYPGKEGMPVDISCSIVGSDLIFVIDDQGVAFDPTAHEDPDITLDAMDRPIGGLGIMLVRNIMETVSYERTRDGHNRLTLTMKM